MWNFLRTNLSGEEFYNSTVLQWALGSLVFSYFLVFSSWVRDDVITSEAVKSFSHLCPPYFQGCDQLYFLQALPYGYSQTIFYMCLFALLIWVVYAMSRKDWLSAQLTLIPIFFWHFFNIFVFSYAYVGNYEYYLVAFGIILLFVPHKEFFLKLTLVLFYSLSVFAKIHPAWIAGGYFTSLRTGLPFFPDWSIPLWTNLVIMMELIGAWFLMGRNMLMQRIVLVFFALFHLYSGILVEYRYPATVLPFLLILFGPWYRYTVIPLDKKAIVGWIFVFMLLSLQVFAQFGISGDEKLTLEGNQYGLYMFESNHQCITHVTIWDTDGTLLKETNRVRASARNRCDPYILWFHYKHVCEAFESVARVTITHDHSLNGGPFYRIIDEDNLCDVEYKAFSRNLWIKTSEDNPEVMGYPVKNFYH